jgi:hypothetical protein
MSKEGKALPKSLTEILKEQLLLLTFLVLYAGTVATDTYYATMNVGYQFLSLPASHLTYRGITTLFQEPPLFIVYLLAVVALIVDDRLVAEERWYGRWRTIAAYVLVVLMLIVTFPLARRGGRNAAVADLRDATSTLPRVHIVTTDGTDFSMDGRWRLVLQAGGRTAIVQASNPEQERLNGKSVIRSIPDANIKIMETLPRAAQ